MKNLINYYYGLLIDNFKKTNERFIFAVENKCYEFIPFYGDVNQFYKNYLTLINNKKYSHEIIFNKDKDIITFYDNKPYVLIKKNININKNVDLEEIISYDIPVYCEVKFSWKKLWEEKIDYYEYQISQLSTKYKTVKNSFDYYIGLSENAITLLNYVDKKEIRYYICHKRINANEKLDTFFNPINIIIDNRTRDIAEYIKTNCFYENITINNVLSYLEKINFSYAESLLFFARLLYPSYYFDAYDQVVQDKVGEEKIVFYTKKSALYEAFLKQIYIYLKSKYKIPEIEWLEV